MDHLKVLTYQNCFYKVNESIRELMMLNKIGVQLDQGSRDDSPKGWFSANLCWRAHSFSPDGWISWPLYSLFGCNVTFTTWLLLTTYSLLQCYSTPHNTLFFINDVILFFHIIWGQVWVIAPISCFVGWCECWLNLPPRHLETRLSASWGIHFLSFQIILFKIYTRFSLSVIFGSHGQIFSWSDDEVVVKIRCCQWVMITILPPE